MYSVSTSTWAKQLPKSLDDCLFDEIRTIINFFHISAQIWPRHRLRLNSPRRPSFCLPPSSWNFRSLRQVAEKSGDFQQCSVVLGVCSTLQSGWSRKLVLDVHQFLFCGSQPQWGLHWHAIHRIEKACWIWWVLNFDRYVAKHKNSFELLVNIFFLLPDSLNAREAEIWTAVNRWIQAEPESRLAHNAELFALLRHKELWEDICRQLSLRKMAQFDLKVAAKVLPGIPTTAELSINKKPPRCWASSFLISGGWVRAFPNGNGGPRNLIEVFDFRRKVWKTLPLVDPFGARYSWFHQKL